MTVKYTIFDPSLDEITKFEKEFRKFIIDRVPKFGRNWPSCQVTYIVEDEATAIMLWWHNKYESKYPDEKHKTH